MYYKGDRLKRFLMFMLVALVFAACSQDNQGGQSQETAENQTSTTPAQRPAPGTGEPVAMIPEDELTEFEKGAEAKVAVYFDQAGTQTELAVAPGERFDMFVFAEFNELYPMSAVEYKLDLPSDISVIGQVNTDSVIVTLGKYDEDFMMAFKCSQGPRMWLVKYLCVANDDVQGGPVTIHKGQNLNFLGYTLCDATKTLIRAEGKGGKISRK